MLDWKALYPFPSKFLEIPRSETSNDTLRMHYVDTGHSSAAKIDAGQINTGQVNATKPGGDQVENESSGNEHTILCVHGNPTWSFTYREVLKQLSDRARVIAVDHIGCGLSDKPQRYNYCLQQHVGNLARLIEQLDLSNVTLLVHDWGGAIGFGAALRHPSRISRFVVLNTAAFPPPYVPLRIAACRIPWLGAAAMRGMNLFARAALTMTLNRLPNLEPAVAAGLIAPYGNWHDRVAIARFVRDIPRRKSQETWQVLKGIEQSLGLFADNPTRIVWGMKDWCFRPECLERFQTLLPGAQVQQLDDVGHYVMEEAADEVLDSLRSVLEQPAPTT